jgi:hypothetical protein
MEDGYPIEFDHSIGRAYVKINGEFNAAKIGSTFLAIAMNKSWLDGDRSVLWRDENAYLPESFEFSDIFKTTRITQAFTKPGKSAFVVEKNSKMIERVANFYKSIASTTTDRKIEIFFSEKEAVAWLDN